MLIDARTVPEGKTIETDICIVGAGAAGITLAREFIGQPFNVCLLESGGLEFDNETQTLYEGENTGHPYFPLVGTRLRYFGGSTNIWGGWCAPLGEIDFESRDWIPYSGWPFGKSHLDSFYERAQSICQLGPYAYDVGAWETENSPRLPFLGDRVVTGIFQFTPLTRLRFGEVYKNDITHGRNISTYLYANVVEIEATNPPHTVTRLRVACLQGNRFWVSAKLFILAVGGIENPRLLLLSNKVESAGLGNQNDLVGRFFMEHLHLGSGFFLPSKGDISSALYNKHSVNDVSVRGALTLAPETLRREKLLNFSATLETSWSEGFASLKYLRETIRRGDMPDNIAKHLRNILADIDDVAVAAYRKLVRPESPVKMFRLYNSTEQAPNPESRLTLSAARDSLGTNRVRLEWRLSAIDKRSMRRAHEIIAKELGRAGLGRLKIALDDDDTTWPPSLQGGHHHMGTTRMHVDAKRGVVNDHCQVHGISNLFIAGSSVFPTAGYANPTLTIVALALRLADHIKRLMR